MRRLGPWLIPIAGVLLLLLPLILRYIVPGIYWAIGVAALHVFYLLDQLFSASLASRYSFVMWLFWGGIIGAALGFWTVAPRYGLRKQRPIILATPVICMVLVALVRIIAGG